MSQGNLRLPGKQVGLSYSSLKYILLGLSLFPPLGFVAASTGEIQLPSRTIAFQDKHTLLPHAPDIE